MNKFFLIDNGHGIETPGKRSPDGSLMEWKYCRELARKIVEGLKAQGINARLLVPEDYDVPLKERCRRANEECCRRGAENVILISIHVNAAGNGRDWMSARGWEAWTSSGKTAADRFCEVLYAQASRLLPSGTPIRRDRSDGDSDKEARFRILTGTLCPAVLTENLFQDNRDDVRYLLSEAGMNTLAKIHIEAVLRHTLTFLL